MCSVIKCPHEAGVKAPLRSHTHLFMLVVILIMSERMEFMNPWTLFWSLAVCGKAV